MYMRINLKFFDCFEVCLSFFDIVCLNCYSFLKFFYCMLFENILLCSGYLKEFLNFYLYKFSLNLCILLYFLCYKLNNLNLFD